MIGGKSVTAIVPARGGSAGLPGKNLKTCFNKSLVRIAIEKAKLVGFCDYIWVSSDDKDILEEAAEHGIFMDYIRPAHLATGDSKVEDALADIIEYYTNQGKVTDLVLLLQPTTPLTPLSDIRRAVNFMVKKDADMVISVCRSKAPLGVCRPLDEFLMKGFLTPNEQRMNRQERPKLFQLNNAIFAGRWDIFANKKDYYEQNTIAYIMSSLFSVDIDTAEDLRMAEYILKGVLRDQKKKKSISANP